MLWLSGLILLGCVCDRNGFRVNKSEMAFLGCFLYCAVKDVCRGGFSYSELFQFVFPAGLYFSIKQQLVRYGMIACRYAFRLLLLMIIIELVLCLEQYYSGRVLSHIYLPNTSLLGVLIATQLAFLAGAVYSSRSRVWYVGKYGVIFPVAIMLTGGLLLMFTKGRSGWLGLIAAFLVLNVLSASGKKAVLKRLLVYMVLFVVFETVLIGFKADSSSGRMLIYKISFLVLADHWLWGIGQGQFAKQYNLYQSRYFESGDIDSREALLADNVYYAFNDFLQLLVEHGVMGGLLLLLAVWVFLISMRGVLRSGVDKIVLPFFSILVCVSVSSSFIYSFHHLPVFLLVMVALASCNATPANSGL